MPWQPLLQGVWKDRAADSVRAILADLPAPGHGPAAAPSLAEGAAGIAVLHAYLAACPPWRDHAALAAHCLRGATGAVADNPAEASLCGGLTGVGWAIAHLRDRLPDFDGEDDLAEIDVALLNHLDRSPWPEDFDLVGGLVGFGVYALERLPRPAAVACLERVLGRLTETAERRPEGIAWWTNPAWLPPETRAQVPHGYYNVGLAHGVPGVIALLGQLCAAGVAVARARRLLAGAVQWLLAQQGPCGFPYWVGPDADPKPARLAWCYGDPGVAAALLGAARGVDEPAWEGAALSIARRAARRPSEESGVVDVGLCHGAAGLGHLFNRLFQATGEPCLAEAARSWFQRALAMRRPGRGVGGFEARQPGDGGAMTWVADPGLLTGAAGVALALLAATTPVEPAWDRALLVAIPPSPGQGPPPDSVPVKTGLLNPQGSGT
jgi:lantibiotic modifying enzyme